MLEDLHIAALINSGSNRFQGFYKRHCERVDVFPMWDDLPCSIELQFGDCLYYGLFDSVEDMPDNVELKVFRFDVGSDDYLVAKDKDNIQRYNFSHDNECCFYYAHAGGFVSESVHGFILLFLVAVYKSANGMLGKEMSPFELIKH